MKPLLKRAAPKLALLLGGVLLFAFFSNDFGLVDIQKTAVILAAGIDRTEEGYELTAQISVPKRRRSPFPRAESRRAERRAWN